MWMARALLFAGMQVTNAMARVLAIPDTGGLVWVYQYLLQAMVTGGVICILLWTFVWCPTLDAIAAAHAERIGQTVAKCVARRDAAGLRAWLAAFRAEQQAHMFRDKAFEALGTRMGGTWVRFAIHLLSTVTLVSSAVAASMWLAVFYIALSTFDNDTCVLIYQLPVFLLVFLLAFGAALLVALRGPAHDHYETLDDFLAMHVRVNAMLVHARRELKMIE